MKIVVFGDSFSSSNDVLGWQHRLGIICDLPLAIHSENGVSEYRILQQVTRQLHNIDKDDIVIVCHTNPSRIYLNDTSNYPARRNASHPHCDLVVSDAMHRGWYWKLITNMFVKLFFDEAHCLDVFWLINQEISHLLHDRKTIHISGFAIDGILSMSDIFENSPGDINHMSLLGNDQVAYRIYEKSKYFELG